MIIFLCCKPLIDECYSDVLEPSHGAAQHARERALATGFRQRVVWQPGYGLWMISTTDQPLKPSTWEFDGRTYRIADAQS
jgi:hypothetical protein